MITLNTFEDLRISESFNAKSRTDKTSARSVGLAVRSAEVARESAKRRALEDRVARRHKEVERDYRNRCAGNAAHSTISAFEYSVQRDYNSNTERFTFLHEV